jgi:hypothetical protein
MPDSMYVKAFKPADDRWQRMKTVYDACTAAGIEIPDEVDRYFNGERPDGEGVAIDHHDLLPSGAVTEWHEDMREGYEINLGLLPDDVTVVRVYMSY